MHRMHGRAELEDIMIRWVMDITLEETIEEIMEITQVLKKV